MKRKNICNFYQNKGLIIPRNNKEKTESTRKMGKMIETEFTKETKLTICKNMVNFTHQKRNTIQIMLRYYLIPVSLVRLKRNIFSYFFLKNSCASKS